MASENLPEWKDLTPEQQDKVTKVMRKSLLRNIPILLLKVIVLVFITSTFITIIDSAFVNSAIFRLASAAATGFFLIPRLLAPSVAAERDRLGAEIKEILNIK